MSADDEELVKDLGLLSALTIGVGTMIGAGHLRPAWTGSQPLQVR